ncbi:hypothetical protein RB213_012976, partial [Colletotrichum asianum]
MTQLLLYFATLLIYKSRRRVTSRVLVPNCIGSETASWQQVAGWKPEGNGVLKKKPRTNACAAAQPWLRYLWCRHRCCLVSANSKMCWPQESARSKPSA